MGPDPGPDLTMSAAPRVLHIIDNLHRCSVEIWLLKMMAHAKATGTPLDWTFYCAVAEPGQRDAEAVSLDARIVRSPVPIADKGGFARALRTEVRCGRYQVVHSHHDLIGGLHMLALAGLPLKRRLIHVHNADESVLTPNPLKQALFRPLLRRAGLALADRIVGNSNHSLDTFLAGRRRRPGRDLVHYLGIDPAPFARAQGDRAKLRKALGLAPDAHVLLFAGRMTPEKNPVFAVDVLAALRRRDPKAVGVFVGDGSLQPDVRERAKALGQTEAVRLTGWRDDVPEVMAASDWFILPHPHDPPEGFGIAVVEAQLSGLRCLISEGVRNDPLLPGAAFRRLSLAYPADTWAEAAVDLLAHPPLTREEALAAHAASPMALDHALADFTRLHQ